MADGTITTGTEETRKRQAHIRRIRKNQARRNRRQGEAQRKSGQGMAEVADRCLGVVVGFKRPRKLPAAFNAAGRWLDRVIPSVPIVLAIIVLTTLANVALLRPEVKETIRYIEVEQPSERKPVRTLTWEDGFSYTIFEEQKNEPKQNASVQ